MFGISLNTWQNAMVISDIYEDDTNKCVSTSKDSELYL